MERSEWGQTTEAGKKMGIGSIPLEWGAVLDSCLRRICVWRVPPNWSVRDWFEEMRAHGAAAASQAVRDYDPFRGVLLSAFMYRRVMASALTRYRQEWVYALRCVSEAEVCEARREPALNSGKVPSGQAYPNDRGGCKSMSEDPLDSIVVYEPLHFAIASLPQPNRWLIEQMFWKECTEVEIAKQLGVSQQAVSKRKRAIFKDLRERLDSRNKHFKK